MQTLHKPHRHDKAVPYWWGIICVHFLSFISHCFLQFCSQSILAAVHIGGIIIEHWTCTCRVHGFNPASLLSRNDTGQVVHTQCAFIDKQCNGVCPYMALMPCMCGVALAMHHRLTDTPTDWLSSLRKRNGSEWFNSGTVAEAGNSWVPCCSWCSSLVSW